MNILKIYWFYQVIKNIKKNNVETVKLLIEKHFQNNFNRYFFNISYSYSYDCFDYFYKRLKVKNGGEYFLPYYRQIDINKNANLVELSKIFQYDFGENKLSTVQDIDSDETIDALRYQIINDLLKKNQFEIIISLVNNVSQKSKNSIFYNYLSNYRKFNKLHIEKLIHILNIEQTFFEKKVLDCYHPNVDKDLYLFVKTHYNIERKYYLSCFLRVDNQEVIKQIDNDFHIKTVEKIQKIHESLMFNYEYKRGKETFEIIDFYQSIGYLNEKTILQSFKQKTHEIIIPYTYLPLLHLSKETEVAILKKNLNIIIFNKEYNYNYQDCDNVKKMIEKLDSYFLFIKDKIDINNDNMFIEELLEPICNNSEDILLYLYKKFPDIFIKKSFQIYRRYFSGTRNPERIIQEIINEKNILRKNNLITIFIKAYKSILHHHDAHNMSYFLIKHLIDNSQKENLLYSKIIYPSALPIIKDILQEDFCINHNKSKLFIDSICGFSKNAIYLLENYSIELTTLTNGFMKLIHHENNETNILLASKILEKKIELDSYDQSLVKEHNIDLYKLYQSYTLNQKLENKYQIKNTKQKVVKI